MARHTLDIRHRARAAESAQARHARLLTAAGALPSPWGIDARNVTQTASIEPGDLTRVIELGGALGKGLDGYLTYQFRGPDLEDRAQFDDVLIIEFDSRQHALDTVVDAVLPAYVEAFDAYRAAVVDQEAALANWPAVVELSQSTGKDVDGRDGVHQFSVATFLDRELCRRTFALQPEEVIERLQGRVPAVVKLRDGVLIRGATRYLDATQLAGMDREMRGLLGR